MRETSHAGAARRGSRAASLVAGSSLVSSTAMQVSALDADIVRAFR